MHKNPENNKVFFIEAPVTCTTPSNPAGTFSLIQSIEGARYESLNEKFFLDWMFSEKNLRDLFVNLKPSTKDKVLSYLGSRGVTEFKLASLLSSLSKLKSQLHDINAYEDFDTFRAMKRALKILTLIYSSPFIVSANPEWVKLERNTTDYYNSLFRYNKKSLFECAQKPALFSNFFEAEVRNIQKANPALIGLSVTHPDQLVPAFQFANFIKSKCQDSIILLGGNSISRRFDTWSKQDELNEQIFRKSSTEDGLIDGLIISEGERPITEILEQLYKNPSASYEDLFANVPGIIYNNNGKITFNELAKEEPDRLYKNRRWVEQLRRGFMPENNKVFSLVIGRGCVYECNTGGCDFCAISKGYTEPTNRLIKILQSRDKPVPFKWEQRQLPMSFAAKRIKEAYDSGVKIVDITDEQLTLHQILELIKALQEQGLNTGTTPDVTFSCYMRIDETGDPTNYTEQYGKKFQELLSDIDFVSKLAQGGLKFAQFGLETVYPPKITPMRKGTNANKIDFFQTILDYFREVGILTHVFILTGNPLTPDYLENQKSDPRLQAERKLLGRNLNPDDLEIIEALYNLKWLTNNKDRITTLKQTAYKLSFGSPHSLKPESSGLSLHKNQPDLAINLPFNYQPGCGPNNKTVKDILLLYELWKKERLPTQPVASEYMYHQRLLTGVNVQKLAKQFPSRQERLTKEEIITKHKLLHRIWQRLVGAEYAQGAAKLNQIKQTNAPLEHKLEGIRKNNLIASRFQTGFSDFEDLIAIPNMLESLRGP